MCNNGVDSIVVTLTSGRGRGLISLLRCPHNDILAAFGPFWRISNKIVSRQAGDFVPAQIGVRMRRSASLDQGDLREWVGSDVDPGLS